ncbi:MAG TPA: T9SS type A sorting domain-containing protein [bacterium]|nr:T9SS type A sorting domain-containing protein [bacterium]HPN44097.1 T9SS type A sorting domain-containing protein [bacterium]
MKQLSHLLLILLTVVLTSAFIQSPVMAGSAQTSETDTSWVIANFETESLGNMGWTKQWGAALVDVFWFEDQTERSAGALTLDIDASLEVKGAFGKDGLDIFWTETEEGATAISFDVFIPGDFPEGSTIKVWAQDRVNWTWVDYKYVVGNEGELGAVAGDWNTVTFPLKEVIDNNAAFIPFSGIKTGIEFYFLDGETWAGYAQVDNITLVGIAPPAAELASPTNVAVVPDSSEPVFDNKVRWNHITWTDFPENLSETYNIYVSAYPITDVNSDLVVKLDSAIPRGVKYYNHQLYGTNDLGLNLYYAVTTSGLSNGSLIETPVVPGSSNCGPILTKPNMPVIVPLVQTFNFIADGNLGEFAAFPEALFKPDRIGGPAAESWDEASTDCNMTGYLVMDNDNFYAGFNVIDDDPDNGSVAWEGDGVDIFTGFYNLIPLNELHGLGTMYTNDHADYRFSFAVNADPGSQFQKNGYEAWDLDGLDMNVTKTANGYTIEAKIPFASVRPSLLAKFVPEEGMYFPLKIDVNDNDGENDPYYTSSVRTMTLHTGGVDNDQNWLRPSTWGQAVIGIPTAVEEQQEAQVPAKMALFQNYPNPFNPSTTITYDLTKQAQVKIEVYDILGQKLATLVNAKQAAGSYSIVWNGLDGRGAQASAGVYFVKLSADDFEQIQKMILVK